MIGNLRSNLEWYSYKKNEKIKLHGDGCIKEKDCEIREGHLAMIMTLSHFALHLYYSAALPSHPCFLPLFFFLFTKLTLLFFIRLMLSLN